MAELAEAANYSRLPGYFSARVARGLTPEERAAAPRWGLTADELRDVHKSGGRDIPLYADRHDKSGPRIGHTLKAEYNEEDGFLYLRGRIHAGDGGPGDAVMQRRRCGDLQYVSAGFSVPHPDDPNPGAFRSCLDHVSFVSNPHEPHAQVLVGHSTTDTDTPRQLIVLCSDAPVRMSSSSSPDSQTSDAAAAAAPKQHPINPDQIKELFASHEAVSRKLSEAERRLAHFTEAHKQQMAPVVTQLTNHFETAEDMTPEERELLTAFAKDTAGMHETAPVAKHWAGLVKQNNDLRKSLAEMKEQAEKNTAGSADVARLMQSLQSTAGTAHAPRNVPVPQHQPTPIMGHSTTAVPTFTTPSDFSRDLLKRMKAASRVYEQDGNPDLPPSKRQASAIP